MTPAITPPGLAGADSHEGLVCPCPLIIGKLATRLRKGLYEERAPARDVIQCHTDSVLDEPGHTPRRTGVDQGANAL